MKSAFASLRARLVLLAGLCLLLIVGLLAGLSLLQAQRSSDQAQASTAQALDQAYSANLHLQAALEAERARATFMNTWRYGQGLARQLDDLRRQALPPRELRQQVSQLLHRALAAEPELLGMFVIYEANALDGADRDFLDQPALGSNERGRVAMTLVQNAQGISALTGSEALLADTSPTPGGQPYNAFYTCSHDSRAACILEPYVDSQGSGELVSSITLPLFDGERLIGVVGMDISLAKLQADARKASAGLFGGRGEIGMFSQGGIVVADSSDAGRLGEPSGAEGQLTQAFIPIPGAKPWKVSIGVPRSVLEAPAEALRESLQAQRTRDRDLILLLGFSAAVAGMLLIGWAVWRATRPLGAITAMMQDIAAGDGDLGARLQVGGDDEIGRLAAAFNRFVARIHASILQVAGSAEALEQTAQRVLTVSRQALGDADRQLGRTQSMATAIDQLGAAAGEIARNAATAAGQARDTRVLVEEGSSEVVNTQRAMRELSGAIDASSRTLRSLNGRTTDIGQILDVIRAVSEQTNLLALNAAIEAARAGEAGRGFAVVADEVRNLAHSTQRSTAQIHGLIEQLQVDAGSSVSSMAQSLDSTERSVVISNLAEEKLQRVRAGIGAMDSVNLAMAAATEEQTSVIEGLNLDIREIASLNQAGVASLEDTLQACRVLEAQSLGLRELVAGFIVARDL